MCEKNNGGPAYPYVIVTKSDGATGAPIQHEVSVGMNMRDYFAGQALVGLTRNTVDDVTVTRLNDIVAEAYLYADAMLAARKS